MQTSFYALMLSSLFPLGLAFIASVADIYYFCLLCIPFLQVMKLFSLVEKFAFSETDLSTLLSRRDRHGSRLANYRI